MPVPGHHELTWSAIGNWNCLHIASERWEEVFRVVQPFLAKILWQDHLPRVRRTDRTRTRLTDVSLLLLFLFLSLCPCFFFSPFPLRSSWQLLPEKCCDFSRNFLFVTQIIHNIQCKLRKVDAKLSSAAACGYSQGCHLRVGGRLCKGVVLSAGSPARKPIGFVC